MEDITVCSTLEEWERCLEEGADDQLVVPQTATIINYEEGLYRELRVPPVVRLSQITQLGLAKTCSNSFCASQTRFEHSIIFATKIDYLAQTLNLDRKLAVTAAMLHDIATTPFSDSISRALGIDDQIYFPKKLNESPEITNFLKKHNISRDKLINLVQGRDTSPLGQLVSSRDSIDVDRWSYVTSDRFHLGMMPVVDGKYYVADPFESVRIINDKVVFEDLSEVKNFLEARVMMFEQIYRSEHLMAKEAFMEKLVLELKEEGLVTPELLLKISDEEFKEICLKHGGELVQRIFNLNGFELYGRFEIKQEKLENYIGKRTSRPFIVKKGFSMNSAVNTPILYGKKVIPYCELEPVSAKKLTDLVSSWNSTNVFGYERDPELAKIVEEAKKKLK